MDEPRRSLDALVGDYYARFGAYDFAALRGYWDPHETAPVYLAEEIDDFLRGWPAIEAYWAVTQRALVRVAARHRDLDAHLVAPDLAIGTWRMHWDALIAGQARATGGEVRVTATFRRKTDGWKLIHYVEAPLAPILYVRRLYEGQVTPGFATAAAQDVSSASAGNV